MPSTIVQSFRMIGAGFKNLQVGGGLERGKYVVLRADRGPYLCISVSFAPIDLVVSDYVIDP